MAVRAWKSVGGSLPAYKNINMTLKVNQHVLDALNLTAANTIQELENKLENIPLGYLDIFYSEASKEELINLASNGCEDKLEILTPNTRIDRWNYHVIKNNDREIVHVVHIPDEKTDLPPSNAEKIIVRAWNLDKGLISEGTDSEMNLITNRVIFIWTSEEYEGATEHKREAIHSLLRAGERETQPICDAGWWSKTIFNLQDNCHLLHNDKTDLVLFRQAIIENTVRWRFLSLYRILERGYLSSILEMIGQDFMRSPISTLSKAQRDLDDECSQFIALVDRCNLITYFEEFADRVQMLCNTFNKYSIMLKRISKEREFRQKSKGQPMSKYVNGTVLCYLARCSIVHAGSISLICDEFDDANHAFDSLVIPLENAVMQYVGIQTYDPPLTGS